MHWTQRIIVLFSLLLISFFVKAQVSFVATSDAKQVVLGGQFTLKLTLSNGEASNLQPPDFRNFNVLSQATGSSFSFVNGKASKSFTYTYVLGPKKKGRFRIGPASARVGKKTYKTKSFYVDVVKSSNKAAISIDKLLQEGNAVFIQAELDTINTYLGQQIIVDYRLYSQVGISRYNIIGDLEFPGFYAQNIQRYNNQVIGEVIGKTSFKTKVLKRVALFPQKTGLLEIPSVNLNTHVTIAGSRRSRQHNISSPVVKINVKPLPETNKPESFSGAIGTYILASKMGNNTVTTDDAIDLRLEIQGNGDIKQVSPPKLNLPESDFEIYEPTSEEKVYESNGYIAGKKVFDYTILPRKPGNYNFKPSFTFFSVDSLKYITLAPQEYSIDVGMGSNRRATEKVDPRDKDLKDREIKFIQTETKLRKASKGFFGSIPFMALACLPAFFMAGVLRRKRKLIEEGNIDVTLLKQQHAEKEAQKQLATAKSFLDKNEARGFYNEVSQALWGYIGDKLNIPPSELSKNNVKEKLLAKSVSETSINEFLELINTSEMALFAGMDNSEAMGASYKGAMQIITNIEQEISKSMEE